MQLLTWGMAGLLRGIVSKFSFDLITVQSTFAFTDMPLVAAL